jgi:hypothetical protein
MEGETRLSAGTPMGSGVEFERAPIESLSADPRNARAHDSKNMAAIKASLERFGQQKPIVVDASGKVLAGNATLAAARDLGWTHIDIARSSLEDGEAMAYAIADNRTAELAEWDWPELKTQLAELEADGFDLSGLALDPGSLSPAEEKALADRGPEADQDNDPLYEAIAEPMPEEDLPEAGSVWKIGESIMVVGCPVKDLDLWKPLLTDEIEMVVPYPSAHVSIAPRFAGHRCLFIQPVRIAAAYAIRIARVAGVEVEEITGR